MIKVITFDLDNTLWDVEDVILRAEKKMRAWLSGRLDNRKLWSQKKAFEERAQLLEDEPQLIRFPSRFRARLLNRLIARHTQLPKQQAHELAQAAFQVFFKARHEVHFFDHTLEVIEKTSRRYTLGALTNGNTDISLLPIGKHLKFSFTAEELESSKPDPGHFLAAEGHTKAKPHEMLHVGDHLEDDVAGAKRAGWHSMWFNALGRDDPRGSEADAVISCFSEFDQALNEIERQAMARVGAPKT